ncbi:uridine diphosphate glucose pyrophosphatase NUDT14-like [Anguilla anguilla]|uniref:uridine diphosphate glucose pyrophosphatase NUDT14-like n=1 Tax=Anguilla anguilla TaxID=7936 RepID=UPI0015ABB1FB|nr:uridine diphosphate glucose pyrophosphatase NUDT14-like [Anguilla anguilla]
MDQINNIQVVPCTSSNHLKPFRVHYSQNGTKKSWDFMRTHESVSILIFNTTSHCFVLVKQFRPAVYVCEWEKSKPKQAEEEKKKEGEEVAPEEQTEKQPAEEAEGEGQGTGAETGETGSAPDLPPASAGVTYELCAGPVDKPDLPLEEVARQGVLQECGYDVPVAKLRKITSYRSGVGVTGAKQTLFYAEVSEENHVGVAVAEGEAELREGEVVKVPLHEAMTFAYDESIPKTMAVIFSFVWFHNNMSPKYKISTNV